MRNTDKDLLVKSLKHFGYTVLLMFTAPFVLYQAFKNEGHPLFIPVLIVGLLFTIAAMGMGFYSIKILMDAIFGSKKKDTHR